jgi:hypothetical protein
MEKAASRTRSLVGRVSRPGGANNRRPPFSPDITRMRAFLLPFGLLPFGLFPYGPLPLAH